MLLFLGINFVIDLIVFAVATFLGVLGTVSVLGVLGATLLFMLGRFATTLVVAIFLFVFEPDDPVASYRKPTKPKLFEDLLLYFAAYMTAFGGVIFASLVVESFTGVPFITLAEGGLTSAKNWLVYALLAVPLSYLFVPKDRR